MRSALAIFTALALTLSPAAALAKGEDDSKLSAAEYEAKQIAEGKAEGGRMLAPAPAPDPGGASAVPGPPPGAPVMPVAPAPPVELSGAGLIAAIVIAAAGIALFVDIRRTT